MATDRRRATRAKPPLEYSLLYTATLCLLAAGAVMVYSASSAESLLTTGDSAYFLKKYLLFGAIGLALMHGLSRHGLKLVKQATPVLLFGSIGLTLAVMVPGIGRNVNGAQRWLGAGPGAVPALGAAEGRARAVRGPDPRRPARPHEAPEDAGQAAPARGGHGLRAPAQGARHGHGDHRLPGDRRAAVRGRGAAAPHRHDRRRARLLRGGLRHRRALSAPAPDSRSCTPGTTRRGPASRPSSR